jgi:hypothetical protein
LHAAHGMAILPCAGKVPLTPHGLLDASTDPVQVARWWRAHPDANPAWALPPSPGRPTNPLVRPSPKPLFPPWPPRPPVAKAVAAEASLVVALAVASPPLPPSPPFPPATPSVSAQPPLPPLPPDPPEAAAEFELPEALASAIAAPPGPPSVPSRAGLPYPGQMPGVPAVPTMSITVASADAGARRASARTQAETRWRKGNLRAWMRRPCSPLSGVYDADVAKKARDRLGAPLC